MARPREMVESAIDIIESSRVVESTGGRPELSTWAAHFHTVALFLSILKIIADPHSLTQFSVIVSVHFLSVFESTTNTPNYSCLPCNHADSIASASSGLSCGT